MDSIEMLTRSPSDEQDIQCPDQVIGVNIKLHRQYRGLSTTDLALSTRIPETKLMLYENGTLSIPCADLIKIALVCDVKISEMLANRNEFAGASGQEQASVGAEEMHVAAE